MKSSHVIATGILALNHIHTFFDAPCSEKTVLSSLTVVVPQAQAGELKRDVFNQGHLGTLGDLGGINAVLTAVAGSTFRDESSWLELGVSSKSENSLTFDSALAGGLERLTRNANVDRVSSLYLQRSDPQRTHVHCLSRGTL